MNKIVIILGPTATGKTNLALKLCQKFNGEIISVDSRQAYKEMEIGTGKIMLSTSSPRSGEVKEKIRTYLQNLIDPLERLNAYDYSLQAWEKMEEILAEGKLPFLVGGTGFYLDVILGRRKLSGFGVNQELRDGLESLSIKDLVEKLKQLDPDKLKTIDLHNKYRLIRAIEIARGSLQGHPLPSARGGLRESQNKIIIIGLTGDNLLLYKRADERVDLMIKSGLIEEVKRLAEKYGWVAPGLNSLGYRELKPHLDGLIQLDIAVEKIKFNTHAYIRRQKTYFKKYFSDVSWFDVRQPEFEKEVTNKVNLFLK